MYKRQILDNDNEFHTLWYSVKLNEDGTYNKIENYENVGISSDNTHGNVHFEKKLVSKKKTMEFERLKKFFRGDKSNETDPVGILLCGSKIS